MFFKSVESKLWEGRVLVCFVPCCVPSLAHGAHKNKTCCVREGGGVASDNSSHLQITQNSEGEHTQVPVG